MKHSLWATALIVLTLQGSARAQLAQPQPTASSQQRPVTIFDYKKQLGLSDDQVKSLRADIEQLQKSMIDGQGTVRRQEYEYQQMIQKNPSIEDARKKLQQIADETVELRLRDLVTSRKITATLTPVQLKQWKGIQARLSSVRPTAR
jgi:hypothetical protein